MKPSPISVAMLSLFLAPALLAQSPGSTNQGAASSASAAEVPRLIKFSGTLLDAQDRPMAGPVGVTFALHAQQTGGAALWIETQNVTPDAHGNYTVLLGANSANGVPAELFASGEARWLEVQVERQAEQPRILLVSVPYALKAKDAETLGGRPASAFLTTETLAGNPAGAAAAPTSSSALPSSKAPGTAKKAASTPQPAATCNIPLASVLTDGTATISSIPMFTTPCQVESSVLFQDASGRIGLGRAPVQTLDVNGGIRGTGLATGGRGVAADAINTNALFLNGSNAMGVIGTSNAAFAPGVLFTKTSFYSGGVERMTIDGTTGNVGIGTTTPGAKLEIAGGNLALPNTTSGGTAGMITLGGVPFLHNFGTNNTFVGTSAGNMSMTGDANTGVGTSALDVNTTGRTNAALGTFALLANTTGNNNAAFGAYTLSNNTTGNSNAAFGKGALQSNTTGNNNSAFGIVALFFNTTGGSNNAFGVNALQNNTTGVNNSAFGANALLSNTMGVGNSAFGFTALTNLTSGDSNTAIGTSAGNNLTTGSNNIYLGSLGPASAGSESNTIRIGSSQTATFLAGTVKATSFLGDGSGLTGIAALSASNTFSGFETFTAAPSGGGVGQGSLYINPAAASAGQTLLGAAVNNVQQMRLDSGGNLTLAGTLGLPNTNSGGTAGVVLLGGSPFLHNFGSHNTFAGTSAGNMSMTGAADTGVGTGALFSNTTGGSNSAFGAFALATNTTGGNNAAFGPSALFFNTTGIENSAFGSNVLTANTTGSNNDAFGVNALNANTTASNNDAFGSFALNANTTGFSNSAFGFEALFSNTTGNSNSAFGFNALKANTTGINSAAFGNNALAANTTGGANSAFGLQALNANTTGSQNAAFGFGALAGNTTGGSNAAFGANSLSSLTSGQGNIAIGVDSGSNLTSGSNNIYIDNNNATGSESNTTRIGRSQSAVFISGIFGVTSASGVAVFINGPGQLGTIQSSRRFKHEIADMGAESDLLMKLRPVSFYYKPELDETHTRQYGLVAEEVAQVAPQLVVYDKDGAPQTVRYHFVNAMLLNEVQKQRQLVDEQRKANEEQRKTNEGQQGTIARQQAEIQDLAARLAKLEVLVAPAP